MTKLPLHTHKQASKRHFHPHIFSSIFSKHIKRSLIHFQKPFMTQHDKFTHVAKFQNPTFIHTHPHPPPKTTLKHPSSIFDSHQPHDALRHMQPSLTPHLHPHIHILIHLPRNTLKDIHSTLKDIHSPTRKIYRHSQAFHPYSSSSTSNNTLKQHSSILLNLKTRHTLIHTHIRLHPPPKSH